MVVSRILKPLPLGGGVEVGNALTQECGVGGNRLPHPHPNPSPEGEGL